MEVSLSGSKLCSVSAGKSLNYICIILTLINMNVINSGDTFACMISYCFIHSVSGLPGNDCILFKLFLLVPVCYLSISDCLYRYMFICLLIYPAVFIYLHVYISTCQSVFPSVSWCFHFLYPLILSLFQLVRFKFSFFFLSVTLAVFPSPQRQTLKGKTATEEKSLVNNFFPQTPTRGLTLIFPTVLSASHLHPTPLPVLIFSSHTHDSLFPYCKSFVMKT